MHFCLSPVSPRTINLSIGLVSFFFTCECSGERSQDRCQQLRVRSRPPLQVTHLHACERRASTRRKQQSELPQKCKLSKQTRRGPSVPECDSSSSLPDSRGRRLLLARLYIPSPKSLTVTSFPIREAVLPSPCPHAAGWEAAGTPTGSSREVPAPPPAAKLPPVLAPPRHQTHQR